MKKLILATHNPGKVLEIRDILKDLKLDIKYLLDFPGIREVAEDGKTFEENALKKARTIFQITNIPSLADDSGLEVYSLDMLPGILSARFAGEPVSYEANNRKLLQMMRDFPPQNRRARFRCVAAFVSSGGEQTAEGICPGRIDTEEHGKGGFGYDPLFIPDGYTGTFAELSLEIKNKISHRAKAFGMIRQFLQ